MGEQGIRQGENVIGTQGQSRLGEIQRQRKGDNNQLNETSEQQD
jgi:hypothetical protein